MVNPNLKIIMATVNSLVRSDTYHTKTRDLVHHCLTTAAPLTIACNPNHVANTTGKPGAYVGNAPKVSTKRSGQATADANANAAT